MNSYDTDDMIFALATPWGKSAIAVVRASGAGCIKAMEKVFSAYKKLEKCSSNYAVYGHLKDLEGKPIDDVVITVYKDGHGYTGEESLEISCHGGLQVIRAILELLPNLGFRKALAGEFTLRAFLHSKMDLTRAEAVEELIDAQGRTGQIMALNRLSGSLFKRISEIKDILLSIMSTIEVQLDYSEDEIGENLDFPIDDLNKALDALTKIRLSYNAGKLFSQGARVVLAGPSNAGKSSLFNFFLKEDRSIVSETKGTTRDFIEAQCSIDGIPVRLYDTAGFRSASQTNIDEVELEGMKRSRSLLDAANVIVYMKEAGAQADSEDFEILKDCRTIVVESKHDLDPQRKSPEGVISLSTVTGEGFETLCKRIVNLLMADIPQTGDDSLVIQNDRQKENLQRCIESLEAARMALSVDLPLDIISMDIQEALEALGELTGEVTTDDILDRIFGSFCVGK
jgi:tRNA modification GTPase